MGKKIFLLLVLLILLIIFTVYSFNYKTILSTDEMQDKTLSKIIDDNMPDSIMDKLVGLKEKLFSDEKGKEKISSINKQEEGKLVSDMSKEETPSIQIEESNNIDEESKTEELNTSVQQQVEENQEKQKEITKQMLQKQINDLLSENKIIFKRRSTEVTKESYKVIEQIAKILKDNEEIKLEIAGHTDSRGSASLNKRISQKRANSVKKEFIKLGIKKSRLKAVGYGEDFPIAKDDENGLSPINRRVELNILGDE